MDMYRHLFCFTVSELHFIVEFPYAKRRHAVAYIFLFFFLELHATQGADILVLQKAPGFCLKKECVMLSVNWWVWLLAYGRKSSFV